MQADFKSLQFGKWIIKEIPWQKGHQLLNFKAVLQLSISVDKADRYY